MSALHRRGLLTGAAALAAYGSLPTASRAASSAPGVPFSLLPKSIRSQVGMRLSCHNGALSDGANTYQNTRWVMKTGTQAISDLQLCFSNMFSSPSAGDSAGNAPITVLASIEYPAGTFYRVRFAGATSITLDVTQTIKSDIVPVDIPAATNYFVGVNVSVASLGQKWPAGRNIGSVAGDTMSQGTGANVDQTMTGPPTLQVIASSFQFEAVIARIAQPKITTLIYGDSIAAAINSLYDSSGRRGWIERAVGTAFNDYVAQTVVGDQAAIAGDPSKTQARSMVWDAAEFTHAICEYGTNDLSGAANVAAMQALLLKIWNRFTQRGMKIYQTTLLPKTSSTDGWTTLANQTPLANCGPGSIRTQLNDWIRTIPAPLSGYFEAADIVETTRNSGFWITPGGVAQTPDGLHPTAASDALLQPAIKTSAFSL